MQIPYTTTARIMESIEQKFGAMTSAQLGATPCMAMSINGASWKGASITINKGASWKGSVAAAQ